MATGGIQGLPAAVAKIASAVISGLLAAVAGPILVGRLGAADPTLLNVQAFYQLLATGLIIRVAMLIDRATRGRE